LRKEGEKKAIDGIVGSFSSSSSFRLILLALPDRSDLLLRARGGTEERRSSASVHSTWRKSEEADTENERGRKEREATSIDFGKMMRKNFFFSLHFFSNKITMTDLLDDSSSPSPPSSSSPAALAPAPPRHHQQLPWSSSSPPSPIELWHVARGAAAARTALELVEEEEGKEKEEVEEEEEGSLDDLARPSSPSPPLLREGDETSSGWNLDGWVPSLKHGGGDGGASGEAAEERRGDEEEEERDEEAERDRSSPDSGGDDDDGDGGGGDDHRSRSFSLPLTGEPSDQLEDLIDSMLAMTVSFAEEGVEGGRKRPETEVQKGREKKRGEDLLKIIDLTLRVCCSINLFRFSLSFSNRRSARATKMNTKKTTTRTRPLLRRRGGKRSRKSCRRRKAVKRRRSLGSAPAAASRGGRGGGSKSRRRSRRLWPPLLLLLLLLLQGTAPVLSPRGMRTRRWRPTRAGTTESRRRRKKKENERNLDLHFLLRLLREAASRSAADAAGASQAGKLTTSPRQTSSSTELPATRSCPRSGPATPFWRPGATRGLRRGPGGGCWRLRSLPSTRSSAVEAEMGTGGGGAVLEREREREKARRFAFVLAFC